MLANVVMTARSTRRGTGNALNRRRSNRAPRANPKVNDRVEIWWSVDKTFYRGTLTRRQEESTFRIVYDDGEMEDLDLTNEYWRYAVDPSPQEGTVLHDDDADIVDVVLDGSDLPPEMSKATKPKLPKKEKSKVAGANATKPMDSGKPSPPKITQKETPVLEKSFPSLKGGLAERKVDQQGPQLAPRKDDAAILVSTRAGIEQDAAMPTQNTAKTPVKLRTVAVESKGAVTKAPTVPVGPLQRPPEASTANPARAEDSVVPKVTGLKGTPHAGIVPPVTKLKGAKSKASKTKAESTSQGGQRSVVESRTLAAKHKTVMANTQQTKRDSEKRGDIVFDKKSQGRVTTVAVHIMDAAVGVKGLLSHTQQKEVKEKSSKDTRVKIEPGSSHVAEAKKEDSNRSRSSAEKPNSSFAGERKKKKKKKRPITLKGNTADRTSAAHLSGIEKPGKPIERPVKSPKGLDAPKSMVDTVQLKARVSVKKRPEGTDMRTTSSTSGVSHGKSAEKTAKGMDVLEAQGTQIPEKAIAGSQVLTPTPDDRSMKKGSGQHHRPGVGNDSKRAQDLAPTSRKRDRASGTDAQNATKRVKNQTTRAGSPVRNEEPSVARLEAHQVENRQQYVELAQEILSPLRSRITNVSKDVQRLTSTVLSFKQEHEFYKDVVHRSVVEEGGNTRVALQELQSYMVKVVDERVRETEHTLTQRFESILASYIGGMNGPGAVGHGNGHAGHAIPSRSRGFGAPRGHAVPQQFVNVGGSDYQGPDARVVTDIPERDAHGVQEENFNGHNESPTAIANVNQGSRLGDRYNENNDENREAAKDADDAIALGTLSVRVSHLVARQVTVWLLETPHEYDPAAGPIAVWARQSAVCTFERVAEQLMRFKSYMQGYQTLCSSLGNDAVELQWFVSPGVQEHLRRARRNYAAWDPPPSNDEWTAEMALLRELSERFDNALQRFDMKDMTDIEACVAVSQIAASDSLNGYQASNGGNGSVVRRRSNPSQGRQ